MRIQNNKKVDILLERDDHPQRLDSESGLSLSRIRTTSYSNTWPPPRRLQFPHPNSIHSRFHNTPNHIVPVTPSPAGPLRARASLNHMPPTKPVGVIMYIQPLPQILLEYEVIWGHIDILVVVVRRLSRRWKVKTLLAGPSPTSPMRRRLPTPLFPTDPCATSRRADLVCLLSMFPISQSPIHRRMKQI